MKLMWGLPAIATVSGVCLCAGCGSSSSSTTSSAAAPASSSIAAVPPGAATSPSAAATPAPAQVCPPQSGGSSSSTADLTAVDVHNEAGYDVIVFTFTAPGGGTLGELPAWTLTSQGSATFQLDPSGLSQTIEGAVGMKVEFHGATGYDVSLAQPTHTYTGPTRLTPNLKEIRDVLETGDFHGALTWGLGLAAGRCSSIVVAPTALTIKLPAGA